MYKNVFTIWFVKKSSRVDPIFFFSTDFTFANYIKASLHYTIIFITITAIAFWAVEEIIKLFFIGLVKKMVSNFSVSERLS